MSSAVPRPTTIRLLAASERPAQVAAPAVGLAGVLDDLTGVARRFPAPGLAVRRALIWERADRRDRDWWPQGITSSADASFHADERVHRERWEGRRLLLVSWYSKRGLGSRLTVLDRDTRRYRHVLLALRGEGPDDLRPLKVHAGGICWVGPWVYVAATARGVHVAHVDDVVRLARDGHDYVLPVRRTYTAAADAPDEPLRFSFLSLDRAGSSLLVGEYGRRGQTTRVAHFALDPATGLPVLGDGDVSVPVSVDDGGPVQAQGGVVARGRYHLTTSHGPWAPGSVHAGRPGALKRFRFAAPMGPEDLTYWPSEDLLWSVTEHPGRRWVYAMPRRYFD